MKFNIGFREFFALMLVITFFIGVAFSLLKEYELIKPTIIEKAESMKCPSPIVKIYQKNLCTKSEQPITITQNCAKIDESEQKKPKIIENDDTEYALLARRMR